MKFERMLQARVTEPAQTEACLPLVIIRKIVGSIFHCVAYQKFNYIKKVLIIFQQWLTALT